MFCVLLLKYLIVRNSQWLYGFFKRMPPAPSTIIFRSFLIFWFFSGPCYGSKLSVPRWYILKITVGLFYIQIFWLLLVWKIKQLWPMTPAVRRTIYCSLINFILPNSWPKIKPHYTRASSVNILNFTTFRSLSMLEMC